MKYLIVDAIDEESRKLSTFEFLVPDDVDPDGEAMLRCPKKIIWHAELREVVHCPLCGEHLPEGFECWCVIKRESKEHLEYPW